VGPLKFCSFEDGAVQSEYNLNHELSRLSQSKTDFAFIELRNPRQLEQGKDVEINFSCCELNGSLAVKSIPNAVPRFFRFLESDSVLEMKQTLMEELKGLWGAARTDSEEWVNSNLYLHIKSYDFRSKCIFCGRRHKLNDDTCDIRSGEFQSGNDLEKGGRQIQLGYLLKQAKKNNQVLVLEAMVNTELEPQTELLQAQFKSGDKLLGKTPSSHQLSIDSCFRQFSKQELLSGQDQWFCSKCKEHRDIHKRLELFRIPEVLMVQLKRFQSKKSAQSGKSGFFNLAYA
jgi:hypothetical protein